MVYYSISQKEDVGHCLVLPMTILGKYHVRFVQNNFLSVQLWNTLTEIQTKIYA